MARIAWGIPLKWAEGQLEEDKVLAEVCLFAEGDSPLSRRRTSVARDMVLTTVLCSRRILNGSLAPIISVYL